MRQKAYSLLALTVLASLAGAWAVARVNASSDFRLVLSLERLPPEVLAAAFGGREAVADSTEDWNAGGAQAGLPGQRFLLARAYADGSWQLEFQRGGELIEEFLVSLRGKEGSWEREEAPLRRH